MYPKPQPAESHFDISVSDVYSCTLLLGPAPPPVARWAGSLGPLQHRPQLLFIIALLRSTLYSCKLMYSCKGTQVTAYSCIQLQLYTASSLTLSEFRVRDSQTTLPESRLKYLHRCAMMISTQLHHGKYAAVQYQTTTDNVLNNYNIPLLVGSPVSEAATAHRVPESACTWMRGGRERNDFERGR